MAELALLLEKERNRLFFLRVRRDSGNARVFLLKLIFKHWIR